MLPHCSHLVPMGVQFYLLFFSYMRGSFESLTELEHENGGKFCVSESKQSDGTVPLSLSSHTSPTSSQDNVISTPKQVNYIPPSQQSLSTLE